MNDVKYYMVGGCVRDEIMGVRSNDIDYCFDVESYDIMKNYIIENGGKIYLEKPEYVTIRAKFNGDDADFVLCRKDGEYSDGRRPDSVEIGSLYDDLCRRDFTMNAIAKDINGNYIDPFDGYADIQKKMIRCVGNTYDRMSEDYLRLLRAARFSVTKGFRIDDEIVEMFKDKKILTSFYDKIARERIQKEVDKMFRYDVLSTINFFGEYKGFGAVCFGKDIWLKSTNEKR